jgi:hypothetical protein
MPALVADADRWYNGSMTTEQLRKMHQARPFHPFDIRMADGRSLPVPHPELLAIIPPGRTIVVGLPDGTCEIVDLLLVTSLKTRSNGRSSRRTSGK